MSIRFNESACLAALTNHLLAAMKQVQEEFLREAQTAPGQTPEGAASLYAGVVEAVAGMIYAEVIGGAWAVMSEWGTGSEMDRDNPALADYKASDLWNPMRGKHGPDDTAIRTRPAGVYEDIFGEMHTAKGPGGFNLERKGGKYAPQPPSHALETAARWMQNGRLQTVIQQALDSFPWGNFIVEDGR